MPRLIRPDDFEIIEQLPGIVAIARDQDLRMIWCTPNFYPLTLTSKEPVKLIGTTLRDIMTESAALEREVALRKSMDTNTVISHYQFSQDSRVLCTLFPFDESAFGHRGVMIVIKDAPIAARRSDEKPLQVMSSPDLSDLETLSRRELEVLHHIAKGISTNEIATLLSRSSKTVEKQVNSIHTKLDTHSRAELVRYATERGIQSFSDAEWSAIVEGARQVRKEKKSQKS